MKYRPYDQKAFILMKKHKIPKKWWYETVSKLENAIKHGACESKKGSAGHLFWFIFMDLATNWSQAG